MKKILAMISASVLLTSYTLMATPQNHRHTSRDGGETEVVSQKASDTITLINSNGIKVYVTEDETEELGQAMAISTAESMEELGQTLIDLDETMGEINNAGNGQLLGTLNNTVDSLNQGHFFDYALLIPIIAVIGLFFGPVLIIGFILLYRYKRKKQRDQVVLAAINKGVEIPSEYRSKQTNTVTQANATVESNKCVKGIRHIAIGAGIVIIGFVIGLSIVTAVGAFLIVYGIGEIVIHKVTSNPLKNEGTYEKSE